jgi:hypothetical protein
MRDLVYLGPVPVDEDCVQVGDQDYEIKAAYQCEQYILLIRRVVGVEPQGAKLKVKWNDHDLGSYCEVVCEFDDRYQEAFDYAFRCESEGPTKWSDGTEA